MHQTLRAALLAACATGALGCATAAAQQSPAAAAAAAANAAAGNAPPAPLFGRAAPPPPAPAVVEAPAIPPAPAAVAVVPAPAPAPAPALAPVPAPGPGAAAVASASPDAPPISAEGARQTEAAVRAWIVDLVGPRVTVPARPVELTPAGDHYDARSALGDPRTLMGGIFAYTALARPEAGGIWVLDDLKQISPRTYSITVPKAAPDGKGPATTERVTIEATVTGATGHARIDPSLATPSTMVNGYTGMTAHGTGANLDQTTTTGGLAATGSLSPNGADRMDLASHGVLNGYKLTSTGSPQLGTFTVGLGKIDALANATGISRANFRAFVRNAVTLGVTVAQDKREKTAGQPPPVPPAEIKALLATLDGIMSSMQLRNAIEDFTVTAQGMTVSSRTLTLDMGGKSENGMLQAGMDIGMGGISLPGFPMPDMAGLVPTEFDLQPFVDGVSVPAMRRLIDAELDGRQPDPADVQQLFANGGITAGLKALSLAVGGATFTGDGQVLWRGMNTMEGAGTVRATDFDALVEKVQAVPAFGQGVPAIIFLKGIGKMEDGKLVWHISYNGNKLLVNGVDLSAMAGAGAPAAPRAPRPAGPNPNGPNPGGAPKR